MTAQRITKRTVDALKSNGSEFTLWDDTVSGFGVRVRPDRREVLRGRLQGGRRARRARAALHHRGGRQNHARARQSARQGHPGVGGARARSGEPEDHRTRHAHGGRTGGPVHGRPRASQAQGRDGGVLPGHSGPHREARRGHHQGRQADPAPGRQAAFLARRHALPGQSRAGGGRQHVRLRGPRGHRAGRHQSGARHRQVQGKPPRALPDRRGTGAAGQRDPRSRNHRHSRGRWTKPSPPPSTCRRPSGSPRSTRLRRRRFGCFCSPAAACGKSCTCGGSTSISSAAVCSCRTARAAGRPSSSMPLPLRC